MYLRAASDRVNAQEWPEESAPTMKGRAPAVAQGAERAAHVALRRRQYPDADRGGHDADHRRRERIEIRTQGHLREDVSARPAPPRPARLPQLRRGPSLDVRLGRMLLFPDHQAMPPSVSAMPSRMSGPGRSPSNGHASSAVKMGAERGNERGAAGPRMTSERK